MDAIVTKEQVTDVRPAVILAGKFSVTDGASTAKKFSFCANELIEADVRLMIGPELYDALSPEDKEAFVLWAADCFRHLFNTYLDGGCAEMNNFVHNEWEDELNLHNKVLRLTLDLTKIMFALAKELGEGVGTYGLGEGVKKFRPFLEKHCGVEFYMALVRLDKGVRQDMLTLAAWVAYWNRPFIVRFLISAYHGKSNLLRDACYIHMTSPIVIAEFRVRAMFHDLFTVRGRPFTSDGRLQLTAMDMPPVVVAIQNGLKRIITEPKVLLDATFDFFEELKKLYPMYEVYLKEVLGETMRSIDGTKEYCSYAAVRKEVYTPEDPDNIKSTPLVLLLGPAFARGMLKTLENGTSKRYLPGGDRSPENQTPAMKRAFKDTLLTNNEPESAFGVLKYVDDQTKNLKSWNAAGVSSAVHSGSYSVISTEFVRKLKPRAEPPKKKKRQRRLDRPTRGLYGSFGPLVVSTMYKCARQGGAASYRGDSVLDAARRKEATCAAMEAAELKLIGDQTAAWIKTMEHMEHEPLIADDVVVRSSITVLTRTLDARLRSRPGHTQRSNAVKKTLERYHAMGLEFAMHKPWASGVAGSEIGALGSETNANFLRAKLIAVWKHIKDMKIVLVNEPYIPELYRRRLPQLGDATEQRTALESESRTEDELIVAAAVLTAAKRDSSAARKDASRGPRGPPAAISDELVTQVIDVCFEMTYDRRGGGFLKRLEWCAGIIADFTPAVYEGDKMKTNAIVSVMYEDGEVGTLAVDRPSYWDAMKGGGWRIHVEGDDSGTDTDESGVVDHDSDAA